jgi:hypothetical protein
MRQGYFCCHLQSHTGCLVMKALTAVGAAAAFAFAVGLGMAPASAATTTQHHATQTFHDAVPCVGEATITIVFNAVQHESTNPGGGFHETDTMTGTFSAVLDAGGTSSGKFTMWDGFNTADGVTGEGSFTFNGHVSDGVGAGTNWHENAHFVGPVEPTAIPKLAFDKFRCF